MLVILPSRSKTTFLDYRKVKKQTVVSCNSLKKMEMQPFNN